MPGNLEKILPGESRGKGAGVIPHEMKHLIDVCSNEVPYKLLSLAVKCPEFFKSGPIIFPNRIQSIVDWIEDEDPKRSKNQNNFLEQLESTAVSAPWYFGFNDLMFQKTGFSGLEANFTDIKCAFWFQGLDKLKKDALLIYDIFRAKCKTHGHTFLSKFHVNSFSEYSHWNGYKKIPNRDGIQNAICFLVNKEIFTLARGKIFKFGGKIEEVIHLTRYWKAEENVVRSLEEIMKAGKNVQYKVDLKDERFSKIQMDADQMKAAKSILENHITIVSGRGGTGKTQVVSDVLGAIQDTFEGASSKHNSDDEAGDVEDVKEEEIREIVYCAPTGKAANVISRRVGSKAYTIHQIIRSYEISEKKDTQFKFSPVRILAVDECSMVSPELFQWLLNCLLKSSKLEKIVLLGDHMQLPSVDPGNMLEDLHKALHHQGMVITLMTNHRSEGQTIFNNATKISNQELPSFDVDESFILVEPPNQKNAETTVRDEEEDDSEPKLIEHKKFKYLYTSIDDVKKEFYKSLLQNHRSLYGFEDDETSQIISFRNVEGQFINDNACQIYNGHTTWKQKEEEKKSNKYQDEDSDTCSASDLSMVSPSHKEKADKQEKENDYFDKSYRVGDKIICTRNADVEVLKRTDVKEEVFKRNKNKKYKEDDSIKLKADIVRLMNGQMFKIRAHIKRTINGDKKKYMVIDDLTGALTRISLSQLESCTRIKHSWAVTIHKMQGSEADTIVYILSGIDYETWKHVYTAVTRGKKKVVIVGYYEELEKAITKPYYRRQTTLEEKVRNLFVSTETRKVTEERKMQKKRLDTSVTLEEVEKDQMTNRPFKREAFSSPEKGERRQKRRIDSDLSLDGNDVIKRCKNLMEEMGREGNSLIHKASECQEDVKRMMKPPEADEEQEARERAEARRLFENWWSKPLNL